VTANALLQGQGVKGQGHSVCNRQRRFTAKSVQISCLLNVEKWAWHHVCDWWLPGGTSENFRKHNIFEQKTQKMLIIRQIDWRKVGWPLSCNAFAIARFLVSYFLTMLTQSDATAAAANDDSDYNTQV